jgi:CYTH domain-containing protein
VHLIYRFLIISLAFTFSFAYYAKVEPIESYVIKSDVSGKVIDVNRSAVATNYKGVVIKVDSYQDEVNLKNYQNQVKNLRNILKAQKEIMLRKKATYESYKKLKSKSTYEKNLKFYEYANSLIAYNQTKNSISNLKAKMATLKDTISKKHIKFKNYIYEIDVHKGDYLNFGTLIAKTMDLSKKKLYIYVPIEKIDSIKNKKVYINSKLSNFKIAYIQKIADSKFVTSYKVKLVGNYPKCSEIVKVEFR